MPHRRVALAGARHLPAARRLEQLVIAGPVGTRAARAVGAGMAVDDVGVDRADRRFVDPEAARGRHAQVVVQHVGLGQQRVDRRAGGRRLEVEGHAPLAPLAPEERPLDPAHPFAARRLDLHHVGAQVGEEHGPERTGEERARVDHLHALERPAELGAGGGRGTLRRPPLPLVAHLVGVLTELRCEPTHARRRVDGQGRSRHGDPAEVGMVDLDDVAVRPRLLVGEDLAGRQRGLHGHVVGPEGLQPLGARVQQQRFGPAVEHPEERVRILALTFRADLGHGLAEQRRLRRFTHQVQPDAVAGFEQRSPGLRLRHARRQGR